MTGAGDGSAHLLLLAFESAHHPVEEPLRLALEAAESQGGRPDEPRVTEPSRPSAPSVLMGRKLKEGLRNRPINGEERPNGDDSAAEAWRGGCLARSRHRPHEFAFLAA